MLSRTDDLIIDGFVRDGLLDEPNSVLGYSWLSGSHLGLTA